MADPVLANLKRKLNRWELDHLRQHAAELAEQLERAKDDVAYYRDLSEHWHNQAMGMITDLQGGGAVIGMAQDGTLSVIETPEAA